MAKPLINEAKKEFEVKTKSLTGDGVYASGKMQKEMSEKRIELISKIPTPKIEGKFSKEEFNIDINKEKIVCPEGEVTNKYRKGKDAHGETTKTFIFPKESL